MGYFTQSTDDNPDAYTKAIQAAGPKIAPPPGGGYFSDQMQQAGQEYDAGNIGKAAGIGVRGALTAPLVAVGEAFHRAGQDVVGAGRAAAPFFSGLTGIDSLPGSSSAPPPGTGGTADTRISVSPAGQRGVFDRGLGEQQLGGAVNGAGIGNAGQVPTAQPVFASAVPDVAPAEGVSDAERMNAPFRQQRQDLELRGQLADAQQLNSIKQRDAESADAGRRIQTGLDADRAGRNAAVAAFSAKYGVFGGTASQQAESQAIAAGQVAPAQTRAAKLRDEYNAPTAPPGRNAIDDIAKTEGVLNVAQESRNRGALTGQALASGSVDIAGKKIAQQAAKLDLKGRQRLDELGAKLTTATDPAEIAQIHASMLALLGKDKPEEYTVVHAPGATHVDQKTYAVTKDPDSLFVVNRRSGKIEMHGGPQSSSAPTPPDGFIGRDANGKAFKMVNGKPEPYGG